MRGHRIKFVYGDFQSIFYSIIYGGTDKFVDNLHVKEGNKGSETVIPKSSVGLQKRLQQRPGGDFL